MGDGKTWWHTQNEEYLNGPCETRDAAIAAGIYEFCGEPFLVCEGKRFKYQPPSFDACWLAEQFDDANCEYGPEDEGPSAAWSDDACRELENALEATFREWLERHRYDDAWAIDASLYERITEEMISARKVSQ